jgi:hypothetical protein
MVVSQPANYYIFFCGNGNANHHSGTGVFVCKGIISSLKMTEFVSDTMYIRLRRGLWFDVIAMNVHAPAEDKRGNQKHSFYVDHLIICLIIFGSTM